MKFNDFESPFATHTDAVVALERRLQEKLVAADKVGLGWQLLRYWRESRCDERHLQWIHLLGMPAPAEGREVDISTIATLMSAAKMKGLAHPKIRLNGLVIKEGWRAGAIVAIRGRLVGETKPGTNVMELKARATKEDEELLRRVASDPARECAVIGIRTNQCCFCGLTLTTPESVGNGYGPVCADKWGLPWSDTAAAEREKKLRRLHQLSAEMKSLDQDVRN